jgi:hypothetical protein
MGLLARWRVNEGHDVETGRVIFSASARDLTHLDVRIGPCGSHRGPQGNSGRPLASLWSQQPDSIESVEALFQTLIPQADASPWQATRIEPPGSLHTLKQNFADALAGLHDRSYEGDKDHPDTVPYEEVAARWLTTTPWPRGQDIDGLVGRLLWDAGEAQEARIKRHGLYCWFGPIILDESLEDGRMTMRDVIRTRSQKRRAK